MPARPFPALPPGPGGCRQPWRALREAGPGVPWGLRERRPSPAPAAGDNEEDARSELLVGSEIYLKAFLHSSLRSCQLLTLKMGKELSETLVSLIW